MMKTTCVQIQQKEIVRILIVEYGNGNADVISDDGSVAVIFKDEDGDGYIMDVNLCKVTDLGRIEGYIETYENLSSSWISVDRYYQALDDAIVDFMSRHGIPDAEIYKVQFMDDINYFLFGYRVADLCAGVGGIRLGVEQAFKDDVTVTYAAEIDTFASKTYDANFHHDPLGDLTEVKQDDVAPFDMLLAGFPCQTFSMAGQKKGFKEKRGIIFFHILDFIDAKKPACFLLENVKHLLNHDKGRTFKVIKESLEQRGYKLFYKVLDSSDYGVPQHRERIFIIGFNRDLDYEFPEPTCPTPSLSSILQDDVDPSYHISQQYWNTMRARKRRHEARGNGYGYNVLDKDGIANTLVCGGMGHERNMIQDAPVEGHWKEGDDPKKKKNNAGIRRMTEEEWKRLQGFPDGFVFPVSKTQQYKQLANSVTVPVIEALAGQLKKALMKGMFGEPVGA